MKLVHKKTGEIYDPDEFVILTDDERKWFL